MAKKRTTDNSMISIVAIVAIVAIVVMITSIGGLKKELSLDLGEQVVGQKIENKEDLTPINYKYKEPPVPPEPLLIPLEGQRDPDFTESIWNIIDLSTEFAEYGGGSRDPCPSFDQEFINQYFLISNEYGSGIQFDFMGDICIDGPLDLGLGVLIFKSSGTQGLTVNCQGNEIIGNGPFGIVVYDNVQLDNCIVKGRTRNSGDGLYEGTGFLLYGGGQLINGKSENNAFIGYKTAENSIVQSVISTNNNYGFLVDDTSQIMSSVALDNLLGFYLRTGTIKDLSVASENEIDGFLIEGGQIIDSVSFLNENNGFTSKGGSITESTSQENKGNGFDIIDGSVTLSNSYWNRRNGFTMTEIPTVWREPGDSHLDLKKTVGEMFLASARLRLIYSPFRFIVKIYDMTMGKKK